MQLFLLLYYYIIIMKNNKIIFNQMNMINITCMNFIYKIIYFNNNFFSYLWLDITDSFFLYLALLV